MGVMAVTRIYSTLIFIVAPLIAILLGFSPKFGALIQTIPGPVLGGLSIVVFGLIAAASLLLLREPLTFQAAMGIGTLGAGVALMSLRGGRAMQKVDPVGIGF